MLLSHSLYWSNFFASFLNMQNKLFFLSMIGMAAGVYSSIYFPRGIA